MSKILYDTAQICLNGHVINDSFEREPEKNKEYCRDCGAKTITKCPNCEKEIEGAKYIIPYALSGPYAKELFPGNRYEKVSNYEKPKYCTNCGTPYPWTEKKIKAVHELTQELDNLTSEEKEMLGKSIDDIIKETPETKLAVTRIKKFLPKIGKEAGNILKDLLVDIASESVKKMLWG